MRIRFLSHLGLLPLTGTLVLASPTMAATLQTNVNYGASGAVMNVYVPDKIDKAPGIVVALHYCGGSATNAASWLTPTLAEQYGFIVIAPGLPAGDADGCWDVGSAQTKTHDGGSHSKAIVQMVQWTITKYSADPKRVFAAGASSGAMMTNVLLGAYPDVFAAGSVLAGVPFGCWTAADGWTSACAEGSTVKSAAQWGDLVRGAYSGYTGSRPRVQLFHGTADTTLNYKNLAEEIKQWTNVLSLSDTPSSTEQSTPKSGWTRTTYKNTAGVVALQVSIGSGVGHDLTGQGLWSDVIKFFGLDQDAPITGTGGSGAGGAASGGSANGGASTGGRSGDAGGTGGSATARGGASSGGAATGGGQSGGRTATGGRAATGGAMTSSGGAVDTGNGGNGGAIAAKGGNSSSSGGAVTASSGAANDGIGGASATASGGLLAAAGVGAAASNGSGSPLDDAGCSCRVVGESGRSHGLLAFLISTIGLGAVFRLRRRSRGVD